MPITEITADSNEQLSLYTSEKNCRVDALIVTEREQRYLLAIGDRSFSITAGTVRTLLSERRLPASISIAFMDFAMTHDTLRLGCPAFDNAPDFAVFM